MILPLVFLALYCGTAEANLQDFLLSDHFERVLSSPNFVDKSLLIKYLLETLPKVSSEKMLVINAPPGFGKSTNLDMLKIFMERPIDRDGVHQERFTSKNYKFFHDHKLNIYSDKPFFEKHFARYPVLSLNFNRPNKSAGNVKSFFSSVIKTLKSQHSYLPASWTSSQSKCDNSTELKQCLNFFLEDMYHFFNDSCVVLVDANETPVTNGFLGKKGSEDLLELSQFMKNGFYEYLVQNKQVSRIFVFRRVTGEGTCDPSSPCKDYKHLSIFEDKDLSKYFGFTEDEVVKLLQKENRTRRINYVRYWYGGYRVKGIPSQLYSFSSVLGYLNSGIFQSYMVKPASFLDSEIAFSFNSLGRFVEQASEGECPIVLAEGLETNNVQNMIRGFDVHDSDTGSHSPKQIVLQYLTEFGFFTANYNFDGIERFKARWGTKFVNDKIVTIRVPNFEAKLELTKGFNKYKYYLQKYNISQEIQLEFVEIVKNLSQSRVSLLKFGNQIAKIFSSKKPENEAELVGPLFAFIFQNNAFQDVKRDLAKNDKKTVHLFLQKLRYRLISINFALNELGSEKALANAVSNTEDAPMESKRSKSALLKVGFCFTDRGPWSLSYINKVGPKRGIVTITSDDVLK